MRPRVSTGRPVLARLKPGREVAAMEPHTTPALSPLTRVVLLEGLATSPCWRPRQVSRAPSSSKAAPGHRRGSFACGCRGCPGGVMCSSLTPKPGAGGAGCECSAPRHLAHPGALGPARPSLRGRTSTNSEHAPCFSGQFLCSTGENTNRACETGWLARFLLAGLLSTTQRRSDLGLCPHKPTYLAPNCLNNY